MSEGLSTAFMTSEECEAIFIVKLKGRFDAFSSIAAREHLDQSFSEGKINYIIDLSATVFLDSAAMALLVSLLNRVRRVAGDVKLIWPQDETARLIVNLARFDRVFEITNSVENALESFYRAQR
jgi:anti-anti-sigma factor